MLLFFFSFPPFPPFFPSVFCLVFFSFFLFFFSHATPNATRRAGRVTISLFPGLFHFCGAVKRRRCQAARSTPFTLPRKCCEDRVRQVSLSLSLSPSLSFLFPFLFFSFFNVFLYAPRAMIARTRIIRERGRK